MTQIVFVKERKILRKRPLENKCGKFKIFGKTYQVISLKTVQQTTYNNSWSSFTPNIYSIEFFFLKTIIHGKDVKTFIFTIYEIIL